MSACNIFFRRTINSIGLQKYLFGINGLRITSRHAVLPNVESLNNKSEQLYNCQCAIALTRCCKFPELKKKLFKIFVVWDGENFPRCQGPTCQYVNTLSFYISVSLEQVNLSRSRLYPFGGGGGGSIIFTHSHTHTHTFCRKKPLEILAAARVKLIQKNVKQFN